MEPGRIRANLVGTNWLVAAEPVHSVTARVVDELSSILAGGGGRRQRGAVPSGRWCVTWRTKTGKPGSRTPAPLFTDPATSAARLVSGGLLDGRKTGRRGRPRVAGCIIIITSPPKSLGRLPVGLGSSNDMTCHKNKRSPSCHHLVGINIIITGTRGDQISTHFRIQGLDGTFETNSESMGKGGRSE